MSARVDLHMHSTASDGTDTPIRLLEKVRSLGLECFSLTDHDTFAGVQEIHDRIPEGIRFVPGIEFSCRYQNKWQCHILGYGGDPDSAPLKKAVRKARAMRLNKLTVRIERLRSEYQICFTDEEMQELESKNCPGKPHLAELLIRKGYGSDMKEVFETYLKKIDMGIHMEPDPAIEAILGGGGIPVWAHPFGEKETKFTPPEKVEKRIKLLKEFGIMGLECYYSKYSKEQIRFLLEMAKRYDLLVSGGSDYHGTRKDVSLGILGREGDTPSPEELTVLGALK